MTPPDRAHADQAHDDVQAQLARYAQQIAFDALPAEVVHAATALVVDTLGVLIAAYPYEPCRIARAMAERLPCACGATVIGSRLRTSADLAAFVNATTARYAEANDVYARYLPGHMHGHPSDVILPLLAIAERERASGRDFLASVVLAYEVYLWLCDASPSGGFDPATYGCLAVAMGSGRLLGLDEASMQHCIAMAVVPNNMLRQVRADHLTAWKAVAAGHAGRAGIFAAELAQAGMPGPMLPFSGRAGWTKHVAAGGLAPVDLSGRRFRILDARMKPRPARALTIPAIQAAERLALPKDKIEAIESVHIEVHRQAAEGTHAEHWHPDSRETADHSIPFGVAAALLNPPVTVRSFDDEHLLDPRHLDLMRKMRISASDEASAAFSGQPQRYCAQVSVTLRDGAVLSARSGGDEEDLAAPKSDAWVSAKFRSMTEALLGRSRSAEVLARLWRIEHEADLADLPPALELR